jgi:Flp pilus assembly protein TadD
LSLLADLLSKIKHKEQQGAIPPNLAQIVQRASGKQKVATRIKVVFLATLILVACGFGTIYFTDKYLKSASPTLVVNRAQGLDSRQAGHVPAVEEKASSDKTTIVAQSAITTQSVKAGPVKEINEEKTAAKPSPSLKETPMQEDKKSLLSAHTATDRQTGVNSANSAIVTVKKMPQSGNLKKVSDLDETAKNEKDVALYIAKTYEQNNNFGQAIIHYKKALEKDPRNYLIMNSLANVLIKTGSFKESIQYSMDALSIQNNYVPSLVNLGVANIQLGNTAEGEIYLLKAKSIESSNRTVLFNLGLLYEKTANYRESLAAFQRLADMKDTGGHLGVARVLEKQGNRVEAEKRYKEILSMDNVDPATRQLANERLQVISNR